MRAQGGSLLLSERMSSVAPMKGFLPSVLSGTLSSPGTVPALLLGGELLRC